MDTQDEPRDKPAEAQPSTTVAQDQPVGRLYKALLFQLLASVGGVVRCKVSAAFDMVLYCGEAVQPDPDHRSWPEKLEAASGRANEQAWLAGCIKAMDWREAGGGPSENRFRMVLPTLTTQELE